MDFTYFKNNIHKLTNQNLGGLDAQFKLAPAIRKEFSQKLIDSKNPKKAAVLALFYPNKLGKTNFLLTLRASYKGTHSAQISFPGGKFDKTDHNLIETALRETKEEVGIIVNKTTIFKQLTEVYIPPSNFIVTPFLSYIDTAPNFKKNYEVETLIHVSLSQFLNDIEISEVTLSTSYAKNINVPCYKLNNYTVWGATAMMLSEMKELLQKL